MTDVGVRIFKWCKSSGAESASVHHPRGQRVADSLAHVHNSLWHIRKTSIDETGALCRYLSRLYRQLSELSFECSLLGLGVDFRELDSIQTELAEMIDDLLTYDIEENGIYTHSIARASGGIFVSRQSSGARSRQSTS